MKRLTAFIKPKKVDIVEDYFKTIGYPVMKMYIKDNYQNTTRSFFWRDEEYIVELITNVKIEVVLEKEDVDDAVCHVSKFLYDKDGRNGEDEYEYAFRLKSGIIKRDIITEEGRWVRMQSKQSQDIPETRPTEKALEVVDILS